MNSQKENIVMGAWEMITEFPSLKKLNCFPSFISVLWLTILLVYQVTFTYVTIFEKKDVFMEFLLNAVHTQYIFEIVIGFLILFVLYNIMSPITEGGIIEMIHSHRKSHGERAHRTFQGIFDGFKHFLPLFEIHNVLGIFKPLSILMFSVLLMRLFGSEYMEAILWITGIYMLFALFLNMFFSYTQYCIIFEKRSMLEGLSASTGLATRHIGLTMQLYFTTLLLYWRVILIALFFLIIPFAISAIITFFTIISVKVFFLAIFGIITGILFLILVHLNSTLDIFVTALWYEAYQVCKADDQLNAEDHTDHHDQHNDHHSHH